MESESMSLFSIACTAIFMICNVVFFYYLYMAVKSYLKCKSGKEEELPCPTTCEPGYECKQSEAAADFVIGEVVQEGVSEEAVDTPEASEAPEAPEASEAPEAPEAPEAAAAT